MSTTNLRQLTERRAAITAEMHQLDAAAGDGDLSTEARARFDALKVESDQLQARIERQAVLDDLERRAAGTPIGGTGDRHLDIELRSFSLARAIAGAAGLGVDWARERAISDELERRSGRQPSAGRVLVPFAPVERRMQSAGDETKGGVLVGQNLRNDLLTMPLQNAMVLGQAGATVLTGFVGDVPIPAVAGLPTAQSISGENQEFDYSDASFGKLTMRPRTIAAGTEISRNLLLQATPSADQLLADLLRRSLAEGVDRLALVGGGSGEPVGLLADPDVPVYHVAGADGSPISTTITAEMIGTVADANAAEGALAFVTNSKQRTRALKAQDGEGRLLGLPAMFHGERTLFTNLVPATYTKGSGTGLSGMIYGNWNDLLIGFWSTIEILVNPYAETSFKKGAVAVRALATFDAAIRRPASFVVCKELTA